MTRNIFHWCDNITTAIGGIKIKRIVYIDVLICLNLIINYFILLCVGKFLHRKKSRLRMLLGALFGSLCSLIILLPPMNGALNFLFKFFVSVIICLISFKFGSLSEFIKNTAAFYLMSFLFCGVMLALWFTFTPKGMVINNSTVYFDISPLCLIVSSIITYFIVWLICRVTGRKAPKALYYNIILEMGNKKTEIKGKLDTGCNLVEPFSGSPVIVCEKNKIKNILPMDIMEYDSELILAGNASKFRLIPFNTISSSGLLPCFKPDRIIIDDRLCLNEIFIAVSSGNEFSEGCGCLINPQCLD